ncbi:hypothetical protein BH10BAC3_BH10BAC3_17320 [soil metagenome]
MILLGPLFVKAQLKAGFSADVLEGCTPLIVKFKDLTSGNAKAWKWDLGNGNISTEQNPGVIYIKPGAYPIKLIASNASGSDSVVKLAYINVYGLPDVSFSTAGAIGCAPFSVQFKDNSNAVSGSITEHVWDFGDGQISKEINPNHLYNFSDTFNVTLSVINSHGCKQSLSLNDVVKVPSPADAAFNYTYSNVCQPPAQINFENISNSNPPLTYSWSFGDGITSTEMEPSHTYVSGGNYNIQLISKTAFGCTDTASQTITIGSVQSVFNVADSVCTNQKLFFDNISNPIPSRVLWNFGDGSSSEDLNAIHQYTTPGNYIVTMNADFGSCSGVFTKIVTVTNKPKAAFTTTGILKSCAMPLVVNFNSTSTGAVTYKWLFGDGETSDLPNVVHSYNAAGIYTVSLVTFNTNGCSDTIKYKDLIQTGPPIISSFSDLPLKGCAPKSVSFKALINSPVPVVSYLWNFGDGNTSTTAQPQHVYNNNGVYKVTLTVKTAEGCTTTFALDSAVELGSAPLSNFIAQPLAACASLPISFYDKSSGDVNEWLWFFGDGGTSTLPNPNHLYLDTGFYNITLIAKNNNCSDTLVIDNYVQIFPPIAKFSTTINCGKPYERAFTDKSVGATTWLWNFGDGQTTTDPNPIHTYTATGAYNVSLTVTNGACEFVKYDSVYIYDEKPAFTYSPMNKVICKSDAITFIATNINSDALTSLFWNFGDSASRSVSPYTTSVIYKYRKPGTYIPMLITKDKNGCYDTATNSLNIVVYGPTASFANIAGSCVNNNIIFTDKSVSDGVHPIVSWRWSYGDGASDQTAGNTSHTYITGGNYNVKLGLLDSYGCRDSIVRIKAIVITKPLAQFSVSDTLVCSKNVIAFKNLSAGLSLVSSWSFGDGQTAIITKPIHTYPNSGIYTVSLSVTDRFGCKDSIVKPKYITVSNPQASFLLNDTIGLCPPLLIEPLNSSNNYQSLKWEFGDGTNTNVFNPQHYYGIPGNYSLKLIAKGYGNCYDTATQKIILKGPSGTLNYTTLTGCVPTEITFSSTAKNVVEFVWDFNNGVVKHTTDTTSSYNYIAYGSYLPKLVLIDSAGCKVSVENKDRIVISDIDAGIKALKETVGLSCDSALKFFNDSSRVYFDTIKSYTWNFGDNKYFDGANASHYYDKSGLYNVSLTVISKVGCKDSITIPVNVKVNKSPVLKLNVKDSVCESLPAKFFAQNLAMDNTQNSTGNQKTTWQWNFGDGNSSAEQNPVYTYAAGGKYNASVKAIADNGCNSTKSMPVVIFKNPVVNAGIDTALCYGSSVVLRASGGDTYLWRSNPSLSCLNCATPTVRADSSGWYFANGTTTAGCKASDSVYVKVYKPLKVSTSASGMLCLGQTTILKASGSDTYEWIPKQYLDNPYAAQTGFKPTVATEITYTVIGKDIKNCFSDTSRVTMKVYPIPSIQIIEKDITINAGSPVQLNTTSSPDITQWKWTPAAGIDSPFAASPHVTPKNNTTYTVVATNEGNCSVSDEVTVSVMCDGRNIFIPNTFSPNNDGMNDRFYPRGKGIFNIKSLRIFNRWGQIVFEKMNFDANNFAEGWDGSYKGKQQSLDVYVYVIEVVCDNGTVNRVNGNVTLLR